MKVECSTPAQTYSKISSLRDQVSTGVIYIAHVFDMCSNRVRGTRVGVGRLLYIYVKQGEVYNYFSNEWQNDLIHDWG